MRNASGGPRVMEVMAMANRRRGRKRGIGLKVERKKTKKIKTKKG